VDARRWPNLFVVGVSRAGTTSLWNYLDQHPDVYMAPVKEPYFFTNSQPHWVDFPQDEEAYLALFAGATHERLLGEATPDYLWEEAIPPAIKRVSPEAKILISLRNPADRLHSLYWLRRLYRLERRRSFADVVQEELRLECGASDGYSYLDRGFYAEAVERYVDTFGEDVFVLFFEELVSSVPAQMRLVFDFLGVDGAVADRLEAEVHYPAAVPRNALADRLLASRAAAAAGAALLPSRLRRRIEATLTSRRKPELDAGTRQLLDDLYRPDRERLEHLLGRPVPW
jgi:hypothetical protein